MILACSFQVHQTEVMSDVHDLENFRVVEDNFSSVHVGDELPEIFVSDLRQSNESWRACRRREHGRSRDPTNLPTTKL